MVVVSGWHLLMSFSSIKQRFKKMLAEDVYVGCAAGVLNMHYATI
jgi:hypothetical protein